MSKEKICLMITGVICMFGCAFISIFNVLEANFAKAEIIKKSDYHSAISIVSSDEASSQVSKEGTININTASAEQIAEFLPGIGDKKAKSIVEFRELSGGFVSVDELINVNGIGEKTLENIRPYCRVSD